jgi:uncharacterized GH25 family protein
MNIPIIRILSVGIPCALAALAHYTWIAPLPTRLEIGKPATLEIGHGHKFPASEEAINASQIDLFVLAPSGAKVKLQPAKSEVAVRAAFTPTEPGLHRIAFVQDRGISSRTPSGLKPGGRDKNPNATQAYRNFRTAIAYANTATSSSIASKPLGVEFELTGTLAKGAWSIQLLKKGKPAPGVPIEVFVAGAAKAEEFGKTDSDGRVNFQPSTGAKGPVMFSAMLKDPAKGMPYDFTNYETSLYVSR